MPLTLSFGRSIAEVSVTGSVTSKPSIHSADSCGRVPPMRSRPSRPRTTAGSSGSDCRMRGRGAGSRCATRRRHRAAEMFHRRAGGGERGGDDFGDDAAGVREGHHDALRRAARHARRLEAFERRLHRSPGGPREQLERAVAAGRDGLDDLVAAVDVDADAGKREVGLVEDDGADVLRARSGGQRDQRDKYRQDAAAPRPHGVIIKPECPLVSLSASRSNSIGRGASHFCALFRESDVPGRVPAART